MENTYLDARTASDIDKRVARVLRDLGDPEPPLRLEPVRELLSLDRAYYSATDDDALRETVHRLKVAGKQIIKRPSLLLDVVRKRELKALWVPDRKRILIDRELPSAKQRWAEAHEVGHSIIPWHDTVMHGDVKRTLSLTCEQQLEAEANLAAGALLFLREAFTDRVRSSRLAFSRVRELSREFGNTMTSTLWRLVESTELPVFGLVSHHPAQCVASARGQVRYFIRSRTFEEQFRGVTEGEVFLTVRRFCSGARGPIGEGEVLLSDVDGIEHVFFAEAFFNQHEALTLGVYHGVRQIMIPTTMRALR